MIRTKTALVLGAGASIPFKFPTGEQLRWKICDMLRQGTRQFLALIHGDFSEKTIEEFRRALSRSGHNSVDAFLEHRTEFIDIGKIAIAMALLPMERTENLFEGKKENNWYQYLYRQLNAKFDDFEKNKLSIITFNYDRSIEQFLITALQNDHGKKTNECICKLQSIPIIHVYGKLGELDCYTPYDSHELYEGYKRYTIETCGRQKAEQLEIEKLYQVAEKSSKSLKIIHEEITETEEFKQAHELLREATRIYFLGFGFNEINVKRLVPKDVATKPNLRGTGYKLSPHQRRKIEKIGLNGIMASGRYGNSKELIWTQFPNVTIFEFLYHDPDAILD